MLRLVLLFCMCFLMIGGIPLMCEELEIKKYEEELKKTPENAELLKEIGKYYFNLGKKGDKKAVNKGIGYYESLFKMEKTDALSVARYGTLLTMKARDSFFPWDKMKWVKRGISKLDKAVRMEPLNIQIRLIRAVTYTNFPESLKKLAIALEDYKFIEESEEDRSTGFNLNFYYSYGLALFKNDELKKARDCWHRTIDIASDSEFAERARKRLKDMEK